MTTITKRPGLVAARLAAVGLAVVAAAALMLMTWQPVDVLDLIVIICLAALTAAVHNLGVKVSFGRLTFLPVAALLAYFALGMAQALFVLLLGLLAGVVISRAVRSTDEFDKVTGVSRSLAVIPQTIFSLIVGHTLYQATGAPLPLTNVMSSTTLLAVIVMVGAYLIVYNGLLALDLIMRGFNLNTLYQENRIPLLGVQILPIAIAPFGAVAKDALGALSLIPFALVVLAIVISVHQLTRTQDTLQRQIQQLSSFSAMNRALRTTLDLNALMENVYLQSRNLLNIRNLQIIMRRPSETTWTVAYTVRDGRRIASHESVSMDGLTDWVLDMRQPLVVDPIERAVSELQISRLPTHSRAWMGVPLSASKRVLGVIITWLEPDEQPGRTLDSHDLDVFTAIAMQTGVALENALLYEEAQNHAEQLARLNEISTVMNASLNQEKVLELIAGAAIEVAGCDKAALYLLDEDHPQRPLRLTQAQGFSTEHIARTGAIAVPMSEAEYEAVIMQRKTVTVPNIHARSAQVSRALKTLAEREGFQAYVYIPLLAQQRPIGLLAVYYEHAHEFGPSEIELLTTFANQAALAVANARVYQRVDVELTRRIEQIVRSSDLSRRLSATLELEEVFDLIIDQSIEGVGADYAVLMLTEDPQLGGIDTEWEVNMVAWSGFDALKVSRAPHQVVEELLETDVLTQGTTINTFLADEDPPRARLGVPVTVEGRVIGAIALEGLQNQPFSPEDVTFVSQLAVQAAVAIRNAQLFRRAEIVRDRLQAILDTTEDGLLMINEKSRIVMTNTRMSDFWDFARDHQERPALLADSGNTGPLEEFDPLSVLGEGLGYEAGELNALLSRGIRNPNFPPQTDLYVVRQGERERFVERTATPVRDERGGFIGLLLLFRDVTQEKELEEARENLTSMMVHDLRGPLTAVKTSMDLIQKTSSPDNKIVQQATSTSQRALRKVLYMVNDLLDLSRMTDGKLAISPQIFDVTATFREAAAELNPLAQELNIVLQIEAEEGLPPVEADRSMVERIVLNLLDNALKYTIPGTLVTMRAVMDGSKRVRVSVADQGPGVPDQFKEAIFDRFKQVPGRKSHRQSTGIGLAFCKMAVEAHDGRIWVTDNPEVDEGGAVFTFTLPTGQTRE